MRTARLFTVSQHAPTGFPLFRTDKIPWLFQYFLPSHFSRFSSPSGNPDRGGVPARGVPAQVLPSPLWTEWQTGAKILPCPKLRLRAVKTSVHSHSCFKVFLKLFQFSGSSTCGNFGFNISCSWSWRLDIGLATRKVLIIKDNRQRSLICFHNSLSWF